MAYAVCGWGKGVAVCGCSCADGDSGCDVETKGEAEGAMGGTGAYRGRKNSWNMPTIDQTPLF
eukprot:scaffold90737_cov28-Tisochrysis_lutea.AAC.3